ncbi:hypothetical protein IAU60_005969 [Kwoniella sp. DSM 27419]
MASQVYTPALPSTQAQHDPLVDPFLNAKAQSSRRTVYDVSSSFPRRQSSTLSSVPENHHHSASSTETQGYSAMGPPPAPPSAYRLSDAQRRASRRSVNESQSDEGDHGLEMRARRSPEKGKQRELPGRPQNRQPSHLHQGEKKRKADWVFDIIETQNGAESWTGSARVILVLGEAAITSLAPILYDPSFSDTLLLVGLSQATQAVDALLTSLASSDQTIYPVVQPLTSSSSQSTENDAHALSAFLAQASALAQQFRTKPRTGRSESNSPPSTPQARKAVLSGLGVPGTGRGSMDSNASRVQLMYEANEKPRHSRGSSFSRSRESIFGGLRRGSDGSEKLGGMASKDGPIFDAIVNFVPSMAAFQRERALQDMLHQAVVVTTGVMPCLTRQAGKSSPKSVSPTLAVGLIHVLPSTMPTPLPSVIESFLLSLLPTFQARCSRDLFGAVVTSPVWLSPIVDITKGRLSPESQGRDVSGAEALLFGGVRCPFAGVTDQETRPRAFLASWGSCLPIPGRMGETARRFSSGSDLSQAPHHQRMHSSPSFMAGGDGHTKLSSSLGGQSSTPQASLKDRPDRLSIQTQLNDRHQPSPLPRSASMPNGMGMPHRRSKLHVSHTPPQIFAADLPPQSPPTPDLDLSASSCASSFALGETGSQGSGGVGLASRRGSEYGEAASLGMGMSMVSPPSSSAGERESGKKKGLTGWFKRNKNTKA